MFFTSFFLSYYISPGTFARSAIHKYSLWNFFSVTKYMNNTEQNKTFVRGIVTISGNSRVLFGLMKPETRGISFSFDPLFFLGTSPRNEWICVNVRGLIMKYSPVRLEMKLPSYIVDLLRYYREADVYANFYFTAVIRKNWDLLHRWTVFIRRKCIIGVRSSFWFILLRLIEASYPDLNTLRVIVWLKCFHFFC